MNLAVRCDRVLLWTTLILVLVGMLTVYSASVHVSVSIFGDGHEFLKRNALRAALGLIAMVAGYAMDYRVYRRYAKKGIALAGALLLIALFMPEVRGMRGFVQTAWFTIQPAELAKLAIVIYMADVLARKHEDLDEFKRGFVPRLAVMGAFVGLIALQPDYGSALAVLILSLTMLFLAGARVLHLAAVVGASAPAGMLVIAKVPEVAERWRVWLATLDLSFSGLNIRDAAYQIYQSVVALGSGGLFGRGVGASIQRGFIPDPHTDFAFSIWGEEVGFLGSVGLIALFVFFLVRGLRVARRAPDLYGTLLSAGITVMVTTYAILNIGVACAAIPTTGLPLPFVSYGGSSLVVNMCAVGVLLNISKQGAGAGSRSGGRRSR